MPKADLLVMNARVFTADPAQPWADAVGIRDRRIVFAGSEADAGAWRAAATRIYDGQGCTLMPGIIDSHYHLLFGAMELGLVQLSDAQSMDEVAARIRGCAAQHPDEMHIGCAGLRYELLPPGTRLTRRDLDAILPDRALTIMAFDHHTAWANTRALNAAGVIHGAPTGPNSQIVIGADGSASGELVEPAAYCVVLAHFDAWARTVKGLMGTGAGAPKTNPARERRWLLEGLKLTASFGITSVHNMDGDAEQAAVYAALEAEGALTVRVNVPYSIFPWTQLEDLEDASEMARLYAGDKLRSGRVKLFMDGVLESWTALLLDDYADRPGWKGDALYSAAHFNRLAQECDRRGLQMSVHAIGDGAVRRTLDGFALARQTHGARDSRHRIEHIEQLHPDDVPRFARLGVVASMQPLHAPITYPETHEVVPGRLGPARWALSYPWQHVREAGARLAFGSDWPVVTQNPFLGMYAALNRRAWAEGVPDQRQSLADTLVSYTRDGAYAEFMEQSKGMIRVGMLADVCLLSADMFAIEPAAIKDVRAALTICDGVVTYES